MSTIPQEINNDKNLLITYNIKCEMNADDDDEDEFIIDKSSTLHDKKDYHSSVLSTSAILNPSLSAAYKGKIEVTSKGRRKIFDGVRWQILCRRPDCRKQTNKKSLCITHYKEEYESNNQPSPMSWSNTHSAFQFPSYPARHSFDSTSNHFENEDQNNTISTTNTTDSDEQSSSKSHVEPSTYEGQIECMSNGQRFILKNNKWLPLCKYDTVCRDIAKYEFLCPKHFDIRQNEKRDLLKLHTMNDHRRSRSIILDNHRSLYANNIIKRLKAHNDFPIRPSSVTQQFIINTHNNSYTTTESINDDFDSLPSKLDDHDVEHSLKTKLNTLSHDSSLVNKQKSELKHDQCVQTDLVIPLCCTIHQYEVHSFYSSCRHDESTSSKLLYHTKPEPQSFDKDC